MRSNEDMAVRTLADVERNFQARADAGVCCRCGRPIAPGEPIWLVNCRLLWPLPQLHVNIMKDAPAAACRACVQPPTDRPRTGRCPVCGRVVHLVGPRSWALLCSDRCRNKVYGARFRTRYPKSKSKSLLVQCRVCQHNFVPRRADARTCSPACRQKSYRQRNGVTDAGQDRIV
jgi:Zn finger protein HypA/HybF involved in hydrogenase expression